MGIINKTKKDILILFLALMIIFIVTYSLESASALDEVIDDYLNTSRISTMVNTVHNDTYNIIELNLTGVTDNLVLAEACWREHDYYGDSAVNNWDSLRGMTANDFRARTYGGYKGIFHGAILHVNRKWLNDKYIRWQYYTWFPGQTSGVKWTGWRMYVYDGIYSHSNDTDFPSGSFIPLKGGGQLHSYVPSLDDNIWVWSDRLIDTSAGELEYCTILILGWDYRIDLNFGFIISTMQINGGAGGSNKFWDKNYTYPPEYYIIERSGTEEDYGYINATKSLISGGYSKNGYMVTTDLINGLFNTSIVLLTNASISSGSINIEVSEDGSTWEDLGNIDDGFGAKDLRELEYDNVISRFNFTRGQYDFDETPKLHQIRIITSAIGNGIGNDEVTTTLVIVPLIVVGLLIGLIIGVLLKT